MLVSARHSIQILFVLLCGVAGAGELLAQTAPRVVFDSAHAQLAIKRSSAQVTSAMSSDPAAPGLLLNIQAGQDGYPGVELKSADGKPWDLSQFGHVEAKVTNLGTKQLGISLRIDNDGDWKLNPTNSEVVYLQPGKSGTISVIFGHSYGRKPSYPLKPAAITRMLVFTNKVTEPQKILLESITAAGPPGEKPPVDPAGIRVKTVDGYLMGGSVTIDAAKQLAAKDGAEAVAGPDGKSVRLTFTKPNQSVTIKPPQGAWDLREGNQVRVRVKNIGVAAASPAIRVNSQPGMTDKATLQKALEPGETGEIVASFIPAVPWTGIKDSAKTEWNPTQNTGTRFVSDAANGVTVSVNDAAAKLEVQSITLAAPPATIPDWLGKRPPVEGDWVETFREEFDGDTINLSKWNIYTANYWDKTSHFSKDNVLVEGGVARLRYQKKQGRHNDKPDGKETDYATGFIDTYGKWVQRYGYFESRMKIPTSPGLWPAMWLMPDRGLASGEQWKRASTGEGGMEFDIMEYLSRWGAYRFNVAFHWDGYGKEHKQTGTSTVYVDHDKDGFITTGLLWLPGKAAMYNNGRMIAQWETPRISSVPSDLMFTHVMGGWDNNQLDNAQLPADFVIDYVRCWQRKDLASEVDGVKSTEPRPDGRPTPESK